MFHLYNPNPSGASDGVGDCAVRAVAKALGTDWETAYTKLSLAGFLAGDMPNSDAVINTVLRENGFKRSSIPNTCPDCYTISDFAADHPIGTFVVKSENHVTAVVDGNIYDAWNSSNRVPMYFWAKTEENNEERNE